MIADKRVVRPQFETTKRYNATFKYEAENVTGEIALAYTGECATRNNGVLVCIHRVVLPFESGQNVMTLHCVLTLTGIRGEDAGQLGCYVYENQDEQRYVELKVTGTNISRSRSKMNFNFSSLH